MSNTTIFVSYASEDRALAESIAIGLRNLGYTVFYDETDLPPSGDYDARIEAAVMASDGMIFVASKNALQPGRYTLTELEHAKQRWPAPAGNCLPVLVDDVVVEDLPVYLRAVSVLQPSGNTKAETLKFAKQIWPVTKPVAMGLWQGASPLSRRLVIATVIALAGLGAGLVFYAQQVDCENDYVQLKPEDQEKCDIKLSSQ